MPSRPCEPTAVYSDTGVLAESQRTLKLSKRELSYLFFSVPLCIIHNNDDPDQDKQANEENLYGHFILLGYYEGTWYRFYADPFPEWKSFTIPANRF